MGEKETTVNNPKDKIKDQTDYFTASHGKLKAAKKRQITEYEAKISKVTGEKKTAVNDLKAKKNETTASMREDGQKRLGRSWKECALSRKQQKEKYGLPALLTFLFRLDLS